MQGEGEDFFAGGGDGSVSVGETGHNFSCWRGDDDDDFGVDVYVRRTKMPNNTESSMSHAVHVHTARLENWQHTLTLTGRKLLNTTLTVN